MSNSNYEMTECKTSKSVESLERILSLEDVSKSVNLDFPVDCKSLSQQADNAKLVATESLVYKWNIPAKFLYFSLFCSFMGQAFFSIFYSDVLKFSATQIAVLLAIPSVLTMTVSASWTNFCDKTGHYGYVLALCSFMSQLLITLMGLIKPSFTVCLFFVTAIMLFNAGLCPVLDSLVLQRILKPRQEKAEYGKQRLWGAIGAGVMSPILGAAIKASDSITTAFLISNGCAVLFITGMPWAINKYSSALQKQQNSDSTLAIRTTEMSTVHGENRELPPSLAKANSLAFSVSSILIVPANLASDVDLIATSEERCHDPGAPASATLPQNDLSPFKVVTENPKILFFLIGCGLFGICMAMIASFELLFMQDYLGATVFLLGWVSTSQVSLELPFFFWSDALLQRLGCSRMMLYAQLATLVRLAAYCAVYQSRATPVLMLVIDLLHGLSFALWWSAAVFKINQLVPDSMAATGQGLLSASYGGFGAVVGSLLGGVLFQNFTPSVLWVTAFIICIISLIIQQQH